MKNLKKNNGIFNQSNVGVNLCQIETNRQKT